MKMRTGFKDDEFDVNKMDPIGFSKKAARQWAPESAADFLCRSQYGHAFKNANPQLTIFYAGTVSVFSDISPDKVYNPYSYHLHLHITCILI